MAQSFVTDAGVLIIPGAYPSIKVQNGASGLSTTGVVMLVGEASGGPDFTLESDLAANAFGPDQLADVVKKYVSGPLVDAFRAASQPANDPDIQGAPNRFVLVKTNPSAKASGSLPKIGGGSYGSLYDKGYGQLGNLIYYTVSAKTAEVLPTTGAFTYIPAVGTVALGFRVNGAAEVAHTAAVHEDPATFVAAVNGLAGVLSSGGVNRATLNAAHGSLTLAVVAGNTVSITLTGIANWDVTPTAGDTLVIPAGSSIAHAGNSNVGSYLVTSATASVIFATKLSDGAKPGGVPGVITAPAAEGPDAVAGANTDLVCYSPVTISLEAGNVIDGQGKDLEINELASGTDLFSRGAFLLGTITPVGWISATGAPQLLVSASEYSVTLGVNRQADNIQEQLSAGGQIALLIGNDGTDCTVVVSPTTMVLTPTAGSGSPLNLNLKQFPTLNDLANFIAAQTGYKASVGTASLGQVSPLALDEGTFHASSKFGNKTLRLKADATRFFSVISGNSALVQLGNPAATALAGIPDVQAVKYLAGGTLGATSDAVYDLAIDALELVKGNFLVPLFSRDATADIADGLTDSASTYTIANVEAYAKTHVLKMSTLKRRKNRQAFLAQRDTFANVELASANLAAFRCSLAFQDVKVVGSDGIVQAHPHVLASLAAGMQAAGFYRAIVNKGINCNGVLQAAGDWKDASDSNKEDALNAGLLIAQKSDDGGFKWVSDQTTYSKDNNFVYNSIQAVYVADVIALTCAQRMEKAFVGQSVADISAAIALAALEGIMADFLRLKLIAVSDDAPKGFKNASIRISGTTMIVQVEVKLAGAIYFIPINFLVSQVTQAAA